MPSVITGIIGGIQGSHAAKNAAKAQTAGYQTAANDVTNAVQTANPMIGGAATAAETGVTDATTGANTFLSPYVTNGGTASDNLSRLTAAGFSFNPSDLESTPGYRFALQQGQKAIDNSMAARGLGDSGAEMKAGAAFATNLANSTYQQAFNNALRTYNTNVTSLLPQASMGLTASNLTAGNLLEAARYSGNTGMWSADARARNVLNAGVYAGNAAIGSGNAKAQGKINAGNAWNGALQSVGNGLSPLALAGFGSGGGWSIGNIGPNLGSIWG